MLTVPTVLLLLLVGVLTACSGGDAGSGAQPSGTADTPATTAPARVDLTLGVYGSPDEIASYRSVVDSYNATSTESHVTLDAYDDDTALEQAVAHGHAPDVFLADQTDLAGLLAQRDTKPLGDLLDDRGVDFGDDYSRTALEAFSADRDLQCMPWGISPQLIYYNTDLVDFDAMRAQGLDVPGGTRSTWTLAQFQAAAEYAARPRRGIASIYVAPTLRGIAPWLESAGGDLFDNDEQPTSLGLAADASRTALATVLPILTRPRLNPTAQQLATQTPLQLFEAGKLAMLPGFRSLVPELRKVAGLDWDVITVPSGPNGNLVTSGDLTGLCISDRTRDTGAAADLLASLISTDSVRQITNAGYLAPANSTVALSDDFLQPGQAPAHAQVFDGAVRTIRTFPLFDDYAGVEDAETPLFQQLLQPGGTPDLNTLTESIDDLSVPYFALPTASASPSAASSAAPPSAAAGSG